MVPMSDPFQIKLNFQGLKETYLFQLCLQITAIYVFH